MEMSGQEKIGVVFIHGAGLRGSVWKEVVDGWEHPVLLVDLPMRDGDDVTRKGLTADDYVSCIQQQIEAWGVTTFILVAHSLAGALALQVAQAYAGRMVGMVAIGAAIPQRGGSFLSTLPLIKRMIFSLVLRKLGTRPPESVIRAGICNDLTAEQTAEVVRGFVPESIRVYTDGIDAPLPQVPRYYVRLGQDKEFSLALQDKMIRHFAPDQVVHLNSGHLPMLSNPAELRDVLLGLLLANPRSGNQQKITKIC
ncbi:alpha/beta fold hydrolase [Brevibacillus invocatus]|uniref:alpha/beta fold hydrolase n=1 Tax=Brevibacillus invocatus TaxID=173959 RepID=UPI00203CF709|nr:alpha/beta hydrolase [Brevibacillus invocatus]MCM3081959.1 alpha/beta hydrolase [Brevibacillus invocatus]MCM3432365.1 alpha/beta hydrolase [Brevibacillus invocatus]